jgi:hypothetical protein
VLTIACRTHCRKQLELNEFAEAIMLCVDCFHAVETLSTYKVGSLHVCMLKQPA